MTTVEKSTQKQSTESVEKDQREERKNFPQTIAEEKGTLMIRFFMRDEKTGKILTRLRRKVFFPANPNIEPGWYVATIIEAKDTYGVMDTMELDKVNFKLWRPECIKGIYIQRNHQEGCLDIFPAIPKSELDTQEPVCIFKVPIPESQKIKSGATIAEIIAAKAEEF